MSVNGKYKDFTMDDLLNVSERFGIREASSIIKQVHSAIKDWHLFAKTAGVSQKEITHINNLNLILN